MLTRKDISGFSVERTTDGDIKVSVIATGSENMSITVIDAYNLNVDNMLDSLMGYLDVENSLAEDALTAINNADAQQGA